MAFFKKLLTSLIPSGTTVSTINLSVGDIPEGKCIPYDKFTPQIIKSKTASYTNTMSGRSQSYSTSVIIAISEYAYYRNI